MGWKTPVPPPPPRPLFPVVKPTTLLLPNLGHFSIEWGQKCSCLFLCERVCVFVCVSCVRACVCVRVNNTSSRNADKCEMIKPYLITYIYVWYRRCVLACVNTIHCSLCVCRVLARPLSDPHTGLTHRFQYLSVNTANPLLDLNAQWVQRSL